MINYTKLIIICIINFINPILLCPVICSLIDKSHLTLMGAKPSSSAPPKSPDRILLKINTAISKHSAKELVDRNYLPKIYSNLWEIIVSTNSPKSTIRDTIASIATKYNAYEQFHLHHIDVIVHFITNITNNKLKTDHYATSLANFVDVCINLDCHHIYPETIQSFITSTIIGSDAQPDPHILLFKIEICRILSKSPNKVSASDEKSLVEFLLSVLYSTTNKYDYKRRAYMVLTHWGPNVDKLLENSGESISNLEDRLYYENHLLKNREEIAPKSRKSGFLDRFKGYDKNPAYISI